MMKKIALASSVLLAAVVIYSCSDRGNSVVSSQYPRGTLIGELTQHRVSYLDDEMLGTGAIKYQIYRPDGYGDVGLAEPMPVLYLLSPFRGNDFYYLNHGIMDLSDRMIAEGKIRPMVLFFISGANGYGGCFYGDNWAGGKYAEAIGRIVDPYDCLAGPTATFLDYANCLVNTLPDSAGYRAITGIGMGGYGAMRIAIEYPENFCAVSAVSAPLDFDGVNGDGGFLPLFQQVMAEVGDGNYKTLDTARSKPLQSMFFAASAAFSPHDTGVVDDGFVIDDTLSYFEDVDVKLHLPFYGNGFPSDTLYDSTFDTLTVNPLVVDTLVDTTYADNPAWPLWLENNLPTLLENSPTALDDKSILLMYTDEDDSFSFNEQTINFRNLLINQFGITPGDNFVTLTFSGYDAFPATGDRYVHDILPDILQFHSDHFQVITD